MAEFTLAPVAKKAKVEAIDCTKCVFCLKTFNKKTPAISPDLQKLAPVFDACRKLNDQTTRLLIPCEQDIYDGIVIIKYHKNCRTGYLLKSNIACTNTGDGGGCGVGNIKNDSPECSFTRSRAQQQLFDWKTNCFICGKLCSPKHRSTWSMVQSAVNPSSPNIYSTVLAAAQQQNDQVMLTRLLGISNSDLVAMEARYHRKKGCLVSYTNPRNITARIEEKDENIFMDTLVALRTGYMAGIVHDKAVFELSALKQKYCQLLEEAGVNSSSYTSQKLKRNLQTTYPDLAFISVKGTSDLVCAGDITVDQVLQKAHDLVKALGSHEVEDALSLEVDVSTDDCVLHRAAAVLRQRLAQTKHLDNEYYSSNEMTTKAQKEFVDPKLLKFLGWIIRDNLFSNACEQTDDDKSLNIACDITSLATSIPSPKHIGLSIHLHHEYGSRKLVEDMYHLGYGVSYDELRRFQTSAAVYVCTTQEHTPSGAIIPPELTPKGEGGKQVVCVADNWDHNERTVDGKRTTHAMTSILVSPRIEGNDDHFPRIPRLPARTFNETLLPGGSLAFVLPYRKPVKRPEPSFEPSPDVAEMKPHVTDTVNHSIVTEMIYNMARCGEFHAEGNTAMIPPWREFHVALSKSKKPISTVAFNPILMASPSDHATVYTTLMRAKEAINHLGHNHAPIFFDMGLLTKALEITWSCPQALAGVIPIEGGMHMLMSIFAAVGYMYGDAGLKDLLHESGVFASATVNQMLSGRDFDRAIYGLKLVDEVLHARFYKHFMSWCRENTKDIPDISGLMADLSRAFNEPSGQEPMGIIDQIAEVFDTQLAPLLAEFRSEGRAVSPNFKFWDDFVCQVLQPFKLFLVSTRSGNWEVHHCAKLKLLPLLFAANRSTYCRYMPVLILMMNRLPVQIQNSFLEGNFVAKLSDGEFNKVWMDYCLETTENKALKGCGGIIGLTMRGSALARWFTARPVTAQYSTTFHHDICGAGKQQKDHTKRRSVAKRWNDDIKKMNDMFDGSFVDPFNLSNPPTRLVNLATGAVATEQIQQSLLGAFVKGSEMAEQFVADRLVPHEGSLMPSKSFYDTMSRSTIKTMTELNKTVKVGSKKIAMKGEIMYLRLLAVNAMKKMPLVRVLSFENSPVPLSLFADDGTMLAGAKSDFMHKLEQLLPGDKLRTIDPPDTIIYDGHAVIQSLLVPANVDHVTFRQMAQRFFDYVMYNNQNVSQIHVVFDHYDVHSTKCQTREKRSGGSHSPIHHIQIDGTIPKNWKLFLNRSENKESLARCYATYGADTCGAKLSDGQVMFISGGPNFQTSMTTNQSSQGLPTLQSNQEEADTRMILHCVAAANRGSRRIVVNCSDTDVLVLLLHHRSSIPAKEIYFLTGKESKHTNQRRYIPVHTLFRCLTKEQLNIMLAIYCLSGCDTVSSFHGHGKRSVFKLMTLKANDLQGLSLLGSSPDITETQREAAIYFVVCLYGKSGSTCTSLNLLRCEKAKDNVPPKKLPPTDDSFLLHLKRAQHQLSVWKQATIAMQTLGHPTQYGYELDIPNDKLVPQMMSQAPAAPELLNDLICSCPSGACNTQCACFVNNQTCTAVCSCRAQIPGEDSQDICTNPFTISTLYYHNSESDSD